MAALIEMRLFSTGDPDRDTNYTYGFLLFAVACVGHVAKTFWTAYHGAPRTPQGNRRGPLRKREIWLFLALAVVAFVIVNGIKFQYQTLKFANLDKMAGQFDRVKGAVNFEKHSWVPKTFREWTNFPPRVFTFPDENMEHTRRHIKNIVEKASKYLSRRESLPAELREECNKLYRSLVNEKGRNNIWDLFKTIVSKDQRFWWTQQWFMGYMAWVMFVAIECQHREIPSSAVLTFTTLGYVFGLSGAQCLFYVLLLLKPKIPRISTGMPRSIWILIPFGVEVLIVLLLATAIHSPENRNHGWIFQVFQAIVIVVPPISQLCVARWRHHCMRPSRTMQTAKRSLRFTYFITSVMSGALHGLATKRAYDEAGYGKRNFFPDGMPWNNRPEPRSLRMFTSTVRTLINALGDHDWVSAIGADVLLSAVALCCWAVVGNLDPRGMIECSIWPQLDKTQDTVEDTASGAKEAGPSRARSSVRQSGQGLRRRTSRRRADVSPARAGVPRLRSRTRERSRSRVSLRRGSDSDDDDEAEEEEEEKRILAKARETAMAAAGPAEAAGVAWGVFVLGGLGMASTAVFGSGELC